MKSKLKIVASLVTAFALFATGTFAWGQIVNKVNEFTGQKPNEPDVTLHDDFDPGTGNKDVYVENTGTGPIYVRIKLNEAMNLTSYTWRPGTSDWVTHKPAGGNLADCGNANAAGDKFHDYFRWTMGGWKWYMPASGSNPVVTDNTIYSGTESGVKQTPDATVITIAEYLAKWPYDQEAFVGWIYDPADGYVYWSQPLQAGEATGLLLSQVDRLPGLNNKDYYYAIDVILEAADKKDADNMWLKNLPSVDGATQQVLASDPDGQAAVTIILGLDDGQVMPPVTPTEGIAINGGNLSLTVGDTDQLTFTATPSDLVDGLQAIWTSSDSGVVSIDSDGNIEAKAEGDATITLEIDGYITSITVHVSPAGGGGGTTGTVAITGGNRSIAEGDEYQLLYTADPTDLVDGLTPNWTSSDTGKVTVDSNGKIQGVAEGTSEITLTVGGYTNKIIVTVTAATSNELAVKTPSDATKGFTSRTGEDAAVTAYWKTNSTMDADGFDAEGELRLEDILAGSDYTGVTVTPVDSKYAGSFRVGTGAVSGKPAILYSYMPSRQEGVALYTQYGDDLYITTQLQITQGGKSAVIKVTMTYGRSLIA